jgi:hypothetical protein
MSRIKDIVDKVLEIVYEDLEVESLIQEKIERKVKLIKLYRLYNQIELVKPEYSELTKKRLMTLEKNKNAELNLESFTPVELTIMKTVCKVHRVELYNFLSTIRKREVINARFQMMALLRYQMFYTFDHIGYIFKKDHSSIIHGIDKHSIYYEVDINYKNQYNTILNEIEENYPGLLSAKAQVALSPRITFVNKKINKVKYHKPKGEAVGRKDRFKLTDAKAN